MDTFRKDFSGMYLLPYARLKLQIACSASVNEDTVSMKIPFYIHTLNKASS